MRVDDSLQPAPDWRTVAAIWGGVGLFDATQTVVSMRAMGMHHAWTRLFVYELLGWLPWALATGAVIRLAMRRPLRLHWRLGGGRTREALAAWAAHAFAWGALGLASALWAALGEHVLNPWTPGVAPAPVLELTRVHVYQDALASLFVYYCVLMAGLALAARGRLARERADAAELAGQLVQAQLDALRHQIEPHFLFNALNAIAGLVRERRNDLAVETIARVSEFLRHALHEGGAQEVALEEELRFAGMYLDIQKLRFGERLAPRLDVAPELGRAVVPRLILQPLVENAIKHGIARRAQAGAVELRAFRTPAALVLTLYNDGPAMPLPAIPVAVSREATANDTAAPRRDGAIGLANVRNRLHGLYGERAALEVANVDGRGVMVTIRLPWREAGRAA